MKTPLEEVENAIQENTKAVYIETLGNPNSDVVDIEAIANIAHKHKIPLVVDNTFATPYLVYGAAGKHRAAFLRAVVFLY